MCVCVCVRACACVCVCVCVCVCADDCPLSVVPGLTRGVVQRTRALHGRRRNQETQTTTLMTSTVMRKVGEVEQQLGTREGYQKLLCSQVFV